MSSSLLDIFRASGDANVGQTLLRLARLAETANRFEAVESDAEARGETFESLSDLHMETSQRRVEGLDPRPVVNHPSVERHAGASAGKEAGR